jgi:putative transposase
MKRKRFTEEQIIAVLREHEAGAKTADLARKHGISEATLYNWKAKYGGMEVSDAKRLRALEDENRKLKKLLAESMLDQAALKELLTKNVWSAPALQGFLTAVERSLRKCIRPLASGLLLQPGHDEMRAHRSH